MVPVLENFQVAFAGNGLAEKRSYATWKTVPNNKYLVFVKQGSVLALGEVKKSFVAACRLSKHG